MLSSTILLLGVVVFFLLVFSIRERVRLKLTREKSWDLIGETKVSPLSQALVNLVGMAGGIYLSLVMIVTFLEIKIPSRISFGELNLEPLATISFLLAIIQPFVLRFYRILRKT